MKKNVILFKSSPLLFKSSLCCLQERQASIIKSFSLLTLAMTLGWFNPLLGMDPVSALEEDRDRALAIALGWKPIDATEDELQNPQRAMEERRIKELKDMIANNPSSKHYTVACYEEALKILNFDLTLNPKAITLEGWGSKEQLGVLWLLQDAGYEVKNLKNPLITLDKLPKLRNNLITQTKQWALEAISQPSPQSIKQKQITKHPANKDKSHATKLPQNPLEPGDSPMKTESLKLCTSVQSANSTTEDATISTRLQQIPPGSEKEQLIRQIHQCLKGKKPPLKYTEKSRSEAPHISFEYQAILDTQKGKPQSKGVGKGKTIEEAKVEALKNLLVQLRGELPKKSDTSNEKKKNKKKPQKIDAKDVKPQSISESLVPSGTFVEPIFTPNIPKMVENLEKSIDLKGEAPQSLQSQNTPQGDAREVLTPTIEFVEGTTIAADEKQPESQRTQELFHPVVEPMLTLQEPLPSDTKEELITSSHKKAERHQDKDKVNADQTANNRLKETILNPIQTTAEKPLSVAKKAKAFSTIQPTSTIQNKQNSQLQQFQTNRMANSNGSKQTGRPALTIQNKQKGQHLKPQGNGKSRLENKISPQDTEKKAPSTSDIKFHFSSGKPTFSQIVSGEASNFSPVLQQENYAKTTNEKKIVPASSLPTEEKADFLQQTSSLPVADYPSYYPLVIDERFYSELHGHYINLYGAYCALYEENTQLKQQLQEQKTLKKRERTVSTPPRVQHK